MAIDLLRAMGGPWVGVCDYTEGYWPACSDGCTGPSKDASGMWHNTGGWADCCRLQLAQWPVRAIASVAVLGAELLSTEYRLEGQNLRRWGMCWPCGDDCLDPPVVVSYSAGFSLPLSTPLATGEVACEILAAVQGRECKLPSRAVSITRQGISVQLGSVDEYVKNGRLGLPLADAWLSIVNPEGRRMAPVVRSMDQGRRT